MMNNLNTDKTQIGGATIGDHVFVGTSCVLQHGITIGNKSVLGTLAFVNKNVPENEVWFGNPATFKKKAKI